MATDAVFEFMERISDDDVLRREFYDAVSGHSADAAIAAIVEFAASKGVEVTADDVARANAIVEGQELSDDDLDQVAGGRGLQVDGIVGPKTMRGSSKAGNIAGSSANLAAPFIPGGAVLTAAISGMGGLKN
jgi:predicted ribosomally synthesized peptide with nif11-like leader